MNIDRLVSDDARYHRCNRPDRFPICRESAPRRADDLAQGAPDRAGLCPSVGPSSTYQAPAEQPPKEKGPPEVQPSPWANIITTPANKRAIHPSLSTQQPIPQEANLAHQLVYKNHPVNLIGVYVKVT